MIKKTKKKATKKVFIIHNKFQSQESYNYDFLPGIPEPQLIPANNLDACKSFLNSND